MFRLYVFTCCLQRIFYNRKKIPFPRFFFAGWKKSHLLEFFCWCKGKNPIFRAHRGSRCWTWLALMMNRRNEKSVINSLRRYELEYSQSSNSKIEL